MSGLDFVRNNPGLSTLLGLEFLLFLIISYQVQVDDRVSLLEKMAMTVFGPIQEVTHNMMGSVYRSVEERQTHEQLVAENRKLRDELVGLRSLKNIYVETERENDRLRAAVNLPRAYGWDHISAEVIGRTHRRDDFMIIINKGSRDGIRPDYGVFGPQGIVGIVWEVSGSYAKIMTANNPSAIVAGLVQDSRYQEGFVVGQGAAGGRLENFPVFEDASEGDLLLTSGLDGIFPKGLEIGSITTVTRSGLKVDPEKSQGMFQQVELAFSTDFSRLEMLTVLIPQCDPEDTP